MTAFTSSVPHQPVLFLGHGSPMNALASNAYTKALNKLGADLVKNMPKAILVVSAHWLTQNESLVQLQSKQTVITDFYGFPKELYSLADTLDYVGSAEIAKNVAKLASIVTPTEAWGVDHGAWTVLKHLGFPASIPVLELSIDFSKPASFHFEIGKKLSQLRQQGVLIVGSGNIVHNLRYLDRSVGHSTSFSSKYPWAGTLSTAVKKALDQNDSKSLMNYMSIDEGARVGLQNPDHYLPLLYTLGAAQDLGIAEDIYAGFEHGTLDMRCLIWKSS